MKKLLLFFCIALAAQVLTACSHDDNPIPGVDTESSGDGDGPTRQLTRRMIGFQQDEEV